MIDETLIPVQLDNGEVVLVRPLSPFAHVALLNQIRTDNPLPDPELYRKPLQNALNPDDKEPADLNDEYVKLKAGAQKLQQANFVDAVIKAGVVEKIDGEDREATLRRYADNIAIKRAAIRGLPEDDWLTCVVVCLITTQDDIIRIVEWGGGSLTKEEIARAIAGFRSSVRRRSANHPNRNQGASGVEGEQVASDLQHAVG